MQRNLEVPWPLGLVHLAAQKRGVESAEVLSISLLFLLQHRSNAGFGSPSGQQHQMAAISIPGRVQMEILDGKRLISQGSS